MKYVSCTNCKTVLTAHSTVCPACNALLAQTAVEFTPPPAASNPMFTPPPMQSPPATKLPCRSCGTVNFAPAETCVRCGKLLFAPAPFVPLGGITKICPRCGGANPEDAVQCRLCAFPLGRGKEGKLSGLEGVRGWILMLVLNLIVLVPGFLILEMTKRGSSGYGLTPAEYLIFSIQIGSSFAAGIALWGTTPNAVSWTKFYLIADVVLSGLRVTSSLVESGQAIGVDLSPRLDRDLVGLACTVMFSLCWYLYLLASIRVENTYLD